MNDRLSSRLEKLEQRQRPTGHARVIRVTEPGDADEASIDRFLASAGIKRTEQDMVIYRAIVLPTRRLVRTEFRLMERKAE